MPHLLELAAGRDADLQRERFERAQIGETLLDGAVARPQRIVFGIGDARPVVLIIALVVLGDFSGQTGVLGLRLFCGEEIDGCFVGFDLGHRYSSQSRHQHAALISRSAAARASLVISAPANMRATSSRRRSAASSVTRVATRLPFSSASLVMR